MLDEFVRQLFGESKSCTVNKIYSSLYQTLSEHSIGIEFEDEFEGLERLKVIIGEGETILVCNQPDCGGIVSILTGKCRECNHYKSS